MGLHKDMIWAYLLASVRGVDDPNNLVLSYTASIPETMAADVTRNT